MSFQYELTLNDELDPELKTDPCPHCGSRILTVRWIETAQYIGFPEGSEYNDEGSRTAEIDDWSMKPEVDRILCDDCNTVLVE